MKKTLIHLYLLTFVFGFTLHAQLQLPDDPGKNLQGYWDNFKLTSSAAFSLERYNPWEILGFAGLTTAFVFSSDILMGGAIMGIMLMNPKKEVPGNITNNSGISPKLPQAGV